MKTQSIEILDDFDSFCEISEDWDSLYLSNRNFSIYQSHAWIKSWLEVFIDEIILSIIIIRDSDSKIIFIAPLMLQKKFFFKFFKIDTIQFIGNNRSDYCDFIYEHIDFKILNNLLSFIKRKNPKSVLFFENINEWGNTSKILNKITGRKILFESNESYILDLQNLNGFKYKKKNTENLRRKLEKQGKLKFIALRNSEEINKYLNVFFEQHINKWGANSLFNNKKNKLFYKKLVKNLDYKNILDFKIIEQNGKVIAIHFGFLENKVFYYYKPTYDLTFSKFSPGNILLQDLIENSIKTGNYFFNFGTGSEIYKKRFSNNNSLNLSYLFSSKNFLIHILILFHYNFRKLKHLFTSIKSFQFL